MLSMLDAIILGAVEGLTEFLPISSTAHLIILSGLRSIPSDVFLKTFIIAIQLGAILAIVLYYIKQIPQLLFLWKKILIAFIPAAIIGFIFYAVIKNYFFESIIIIAGGLVVGGIIMIFVDKRYKNNIPDVNPISTLGLISKKHAFFIGLAQALAVIPGVSRSAATIIAGRVLGYSRESVTLFSFLLGAVTLSAAVGYDLLHTSISLASGEITLLVVGFMVALICAYLSIVFMLRLVSRYGFTPFGWYRIILGLLILIFWV